LTSICTEYGVPILPETPPRHKAIELLELMGKEEEEEKEEEEMKEDQAPPSQNTRAATKGKPEAKKEGRKKLLRQDLDYLGRRLLNYSIYWCQTVNLWP
jgi:hypothetical protein